MVGYGVVRYGILKNTRRVQMESITIQGKIKSICPILFDRYNGINDQNDEEAKKNAIHKLYLNGKSEICIPSNCLKASIRNAASEIGKKMESKKRRQAVRAGLFFTQQLYSLGIKKPDDIFGTHVTRGQGPKVTRVVSYRPMVNEWNIEFEAVLYGLTPEFVQQAMELAGFKYGLCGYRPEYGRFVLEELGIKK
jgi:hypothetical protein